jgi:hypothetical protein
MFLPNCIACLGTSKFLDMVKQYPDAIYVIDNQPRNKSVVYILEQLINANVKVCIYPYDWVEIDINDMIKSHGRKQVLAMISENIFSGLKAQLLFNYWKKI